MKICLNLESIGIKLRKTIEGKFRLFDGRYNDNDYFIESIEEIENAQIIEELVYEEKKYSVDKKGVMGFEEIGSNLHIRYYSYMEKCDQIHVPDINQLKQTISAGNDLLGNRLVMTVFGDFILINQFINIEEPYCVLQFEYFLNGNGYIGIEAAKDDSFINSLYATGLNVYKSFLITGKTNNFVDDFSSCNDIGKDIIEIEGIINQINSK